MQNWYNFYTCTSCFNFCIWVIKMNEIRNRYQGIGTRSEPLCIAYHRQYQWVPVIEFGESAIIWDDNQISREFPEPSEIFELAAYGEFDFDKGIFVRQCGKVIQSQHYDYQAEFFREYLESHNFSHSGSKCNLEFNFPDIGWQLKIEMNSIKRDTK